MDYILSCVKKFLQGLFLVLVLVGVGVTTIKVWPYVKPVFQEFFSDELHVDNSSCVVYTPMQEKPPLTM